MCTYIYIESIYIVLYSIVICVYLVTILYTCVQRRRGCFKIAPFFALHLIIYNHLTERGIAGSSGQLRVTRGALNK